MKIIKEGHATPDFLASLDKTSNIIICVPPYEEKCIIESEDFPDTFSISLPRNLNLSESHVVKISSSCLSTIERPKIKISLPAGIKLQFSNFVADRNQDIFQKIYKSFDVHNVMIDEKTLSHHIISDMIFVLYLDTIRMREAGVQMLIKPGTVIAEFSFSWYIQTKVDMPQIKEIYLISDSHIYEDFINIF